MSFPLAVVRLLSPAPVLSAVFVVLALANPLRSPIAYFAIDGEGSDRYVRETRSVIDALGADLVVFDYFPHSVPFAAGGRPVLGLARHGYPKWGKVAHWLGRKARKSKVWLVSSYVLPGMERAFAFEDPFQRVLERRVVKSKTFLDAVAVTEVSTNTFARLVPRRRAAAPAVAPHGTLRQTLVFDGSPIALRGGWHYTRRGGAWSREGAAFVAPLPQPGAPVEAEFDIEWTPPDGGPSNQIVRIDFPGNAYMARLRVAAGRHTVRTAFVSEKPLPETGLYNVTAPRPYDPAAFGLRGYPADLGVVFHAITLVR